VKKPAPAWPDWPALMSPDTAASYLDMSSAAFYQFVQTHKIPAVRISSRARSKYRRVTLDEYIERLERSAA
jgi:excisionase family DNA binding protein